MEHQHTIVMYHYVRDPEKTKFPGIKACSTKKFEQQIDFLSKKYQIVTLEEYISMRESYDGKKPLCTLSFDDGVRDHLENVFPVLEKYNVRGTFFISTKPVTQGWVTLVHKVHFLLSFLGPQKFLDNVTSILRADFSEMNYDAHVPKQVNNRWDDPVTAKLKFLIASLPEEVKEHILSSLFRDSFGDEKAFSEELYLTPGEIKKLSDCGMEIGAHTHTHSLLAQLSLEEQEEEIVLSQDILTDILGQNIKVFSYPNGVSTPEAVNILKKRGFTCAVTVEVGYNSSDTDPFLLQRLDTNDVTY